MRKMTCARRNRKKNKVPSVHLIADLEAPRVIENPRKIRQILLEAAKAANNTALKTTIHKFPVQGVTGVVLLAESHIAIHTWPEYNYLAVDIFTCGTQTKPYKALEYLKKVFCPRRSKVRLIKRGSP